MILLTAGTRPEIVKLMPVWNAMKKSKMSCAWLWSGQHGAVGMETFGVFGVEPDYKVNLQRESGSLMELQGRLSIVLEHAYSTIEPKMVLVQGDTLTASVAAQQAYLGGIPVGHVEAGLRSWDVHDPYPEEACRAWIDLVADMKFAPTSQAALTLSGNVWVTGQTCIDSLALVKPKRLRRGKYAVVTAHRRENWPVLDQAMNAVKRLLKDRVFDLVVWPVHPNPEVSHRVQETMKGVRGCEIVRPLPYDQMVNLMRHASMILTDSGGILEEALGLHVPCLVMRAHTERPEGVQVGGAKVVGMVEDKIVGHATWLMSAKEEYEAMKQARNPFGDGRAGARIAMICNARLKGRKVNEKLACWSGP